MSGSMRLDQHFGTIAVEKKFVTQEKLDRALVLQRCILNRMQVHMPIGKVLKEMGLMDQAEIDTVLDLQRTLPENAAPSQGAPEAVTLAQGDGLGGLTLTVSKDKLSAFLEPSGTTPLDGVTVEAVKELLVRRGIIHGVVSDPTLAFYLTQNPLPEEPFQIAAGTSPESGSPSEIQYNFDIDPLRIGTLKADGTIDWRDRGHIPQVKEGDLLAEKVNGHMGKPGITVLGTEMAPPRIRDPQLKCGRGAQRSEDGQQVFAKMSGIPKLTPDGKISVFSLLPIEGDVGLETGHIEFDGHIEVSGGICPGFNVKGRGLRTKEIQDAKIEISEDLVSFGGIYGSTLKVGGNLKASHIHNAVIEVVGDIVVEKEIFGSTIETNGQCIVSDGKIIASKIDAKKGVIVKDIGTEAAKPSELTVGIDRRYEREMKRSKELLQILEQQEKDLSLAVAGLREILGKVAGELGVIAQEQDQYSVQRRQFEGQLERFESVEAEEERALLIDMIEELNQKIAVIDEKVAALMQKDDVLRVQLVDTEKNHLLVKNQIKETRDYMTVLEDSVQLDPGIAMVKVSGTVQSKTLVVGPYKKLTVPQTMHCVRIAESKMEFGANRWQMKISDLH
jgi:uncharacterized protein